MDSVRSYLHRAVWSYVDQGHRLPGYPDDCLEDQRFFNPDWYDKTWFSLVVETEQVQSNVRFRTEKIHKPLAFYHPFLLFGQAGVLQDLRDQGFETFPEVFDESYDNEPDVTKKILLIMDNLERFDPAILTSDQVTKKLQHNHDLFFDDALVKHRLRQELVNPMREFLER